MEKRKEDNVIEFINKINIFSKKKMKKRCYINYVIYFLSSLQDIKKFENLQNHSFRPIDSKR